MKTTITILALGACVASYSGPVAAQEVVLKVHHFLPANSAAQTEFIQPWCDRVARASNGKLKCQIYPAMQLGGTPPQLYDQARDGVADVVWTLPGYNAGRFPIVEVFELPFIMQGPEHTSKAVWDYVKQNDQEEFKEVKALAFHVHGAGVFHMMDRPIKTRADLQGTKLRAPTRQTRRFLEILGATPISMPVPQVSEALAKGTINGAVLPYEVVPALKIQDAVKFHSETPASEPALYTAVFIFAMNRAKYDSLTSDLREVIDRNSGVALSGEIGKVFATGDAKAKDNMLRNSTINVIPSSELEGWKNVGQQVTEAWATEVTEKGRDGRKLLESARGLIRKHTGE